ncbi:unnamed protein product [Colias eurytheme]|nr:unnamed protein product [Colias eurytheme]
MYKTVWNCAGVGPDGRRIGAPPPAVFTRGCGAVAALHVTVRRARSSRLGHRLTVASPSYCLPDDGRDGGARCTAPLHSACPPAARLLGPLLSPHSTRPAPKNFPHRAGKIDCAASPE